MKALDIAGSLLTNFRQSYQLEIPRAGLTANAFSVISFEGHETLGEPSRFVIRLHHPDPDLTRLDYLNVPAVFNVQPQGASGLADIAAMAGLNAASSQRRFQGVITGFSQVDSARDVTTYELVLESHLAQLGLGSHCRLFIDQSIPDIIAQVLDDKGFTSDTHYYRFTLYRSYPRLPTVMQWQESDLAFIQRLCRRCGIWFRMAEGEFGEQIVFADDFTHYQRQPALRAPFKAHAGLESIGAEAVFALETHSKTIPASVFVRDYNRLAAPACIDEEHALPTQDRTAFGQVYRWGSLHLNAEQAEWEAQLRHEALLCEQVLYHGRGNVLGLAPGSVFNLSGKSLPDAEHGQLITRVEHTGARDAAYTNRYTAMPSDRLYRLPLEEDHWPRIGGTISARIVSPDRYPYAYLNQDGDYRVQFDFDREERQSGHSSCWLRLAKPFAGALQTGFHFPLIEGTEVAIAFHNGHPDAPYIAHALHDSHNSDLITHRDRWMSRNEIRTQSNNKLRLEDWQGQEHIKLATEHGKSQLNLGHLVNAAKEPRGEGLELRTDGWGSVRAGKGLLLSADAQPKALGKQLDMREATAQLNTALNLSQALADATKAAQAHIAEVSEQKQLLDQRIKEFKQAVLLASAPAGMALTSGQHLQVSAQGNLMATAGGHADISVFRKFTIAAGEAISLCAHKLGMKLFAAKGKVELQAQNDAMELTALKDIQIASVDGKLVLSSPKEVWIGAGGSYIRITASGIENVTPGDINERCVFWSVTGAGGMNVPLPTFPESRLDMPVSQSISL